MAHKFVLVLPLLLCFAAAVLVSKNMGKPRSIELATLSKPGVQYIAENGLPDILSPIVCIPGVGGNQLYAKLNKTLAGHWFCAQHEPWYMIWLALSELLPGPTVDCWTANIKLQYDATTGKFVNSSGVDIEAYEFGSTSGFEYLDPRYKSETIYFASVVQSLLAVGYERGKNIFGAPFDWRLAPNSLPMYFLQLREMIEDAYHTNNNTKVSVVAHSMGNLMFMHLLQGTPQDWKDKYIKSFIAISAPWTGAIEAVQSLSSGYDFSIPYLTPQAARSVQRSFESNYFLLPRPDAWNNDVFVKTPNKTYTSNDYKALFTDLGMLDGYNVWSRTQNLSNPAITPNVDTYCLYGYDVETHVELTFKGSFDKQPEVTMGDGDGTVPVQSLTFCENWKGKMPQKLLVKGYPKQEHVALLTCADMIKDMLDVILGSTSA